MNILSCMVSTYLNLKMILIFGISFLALNGFAQTHKRVDTVQIAYYAELEKHLYPPVDSLTTTELSLFVVFPEVNPNSSLRLIVKKNGESYLEVRSLEKNVWVEVLTSFVNHCYKPMMLKVNSFSAPINNQFENRMLCVYNKVITLHNNRIKSKENMIFDGTSYVFTTDNNGKKISTTINSDLESTDYRFLVSNTNLQIINDLKNGTFSESKYEIYK